MKMNHLGTTDYIMWSLLLTMSLSIGLYFAWAEHKRQKRQFGGQTTEFLLGSKQMHPVPIACSLMASFFSAITLLGTPNEIYQFGVMYWFVGIGYMFTISISALLFIPVFYNMDLTSSYEYLGKRFSKVNQIFGAIAFILQMAPYMGIVLYGPCLALGVVINVNIWIIIVLMAAICTIYTTMGGLKAVVWTDVLQLIMMFGGMVSIIIKGSSYFGSFNEIWTIASEQGRLDVNFSPDVRVRHSFWSVVIGGAFLWIGIYGINQTMIQRAISVRTLKQSQIAYWLNLPGMNFLLLIVVLCGYVIFAIFYGCDPIRTKEISKSDMLVPLFVSMYLTQYPGVAGIFVAGIFSGGLSTLSSGLNSLSAVTLRDIIMLKYDKIPDRRAALISKFFVIFYGIVVLIFAYLSSLTDKILQVALALFGMMSGPTLGVFVMGIFFPFSNYKGAIAGHIFSQLLLLWIQIGYLISNISHPTLDLFNNNCTGSGYSYFNTTTDITANGRPLQGLENVYAISYLWYTLLGLIAVLIIGLPVSILTNGNETVKIDKMYITPILRNVWRNYLKDDEISTLKDSNTNEENRLMLKRSSYEVGIELK